MRILKVATLVAAVTVASAPGIAGAAPKNYCADLKGVDNDQTCQILMSEPSYQVNISFPSDYPDLKAVADYVSQTRDGFLNVARSSTPLDVPYELDITATSYDSAIPPRGTQSLVLQTYENIGGAHPATLFKAFNWDQAFRKPITFDTLWQPGSDPLKVVFPIVVSELQKQTGQPVFVDPIAGMDPANYQDFAITNDGVIFFFSQGELLPEAAGATQILVPRAAIDPLLA
ncbi:RsiV family protein [Mycobacterium sp. CVI_P3]|uniref:RsiV family protein n=1 Tax=Mycobacterium pinniadriaticum TaxID=2994102 RepID=A0ABT3S9Y3_9MYCO|nr:esterase [Mycobacterium pinniadriaticum]MCX2929768.1 RsiV family protein [Mycobacterium pinniadriaticum]MCX2936192.1 RsiV family protein [Mycobacterium pinniadriaticum]